MLKIVLRSYKTTEKNKDKNAIIYQNKIMKVK